MWPQSYIVEGPRGGFKVYRQKPFWENRGHVHFLETQRLAISAQGKLTQSTVKPGKQSMEMGYEPENQTEPCVRWKRKVRSKVRSRSLKAKGQCREAKDVGYERPMGKLASESGVIKQQQQTGSPALYQLYKSISVLDYYKSHNFLQRAVGTLAGWHAQNSVRQRFWNF